MPARTRPLLLLVLCGTIFLEGADIAMMAIAVPAIRADLALPTDTAAWVMSAYVLGYAGFTLLGGRAADLLGRRRMFLVWLTVFLAFSGLGGFAQDGWTLIAARFVTGVAAAFMTPAALSLITTSYEEGPARDKALMIFAGTAAGGFSLGMVTGGLLTGLGWRWVFFAPVLFAAVLLAGAVRLIPATPAPPRSTRELDLPGALLAAATMLTAAYTVVRLEYGTENWRVTVASGLTAIVLGFVFVTVERRTRHPLVRLGILREGEVLRSGLGALLFVGAFFGFQFVVTLYLQELRGWSSLQTALALVVMGCDAILAPTLTPRLVARFGNARVITGGFVCATAAYGTFLPLGRDWSYAAMLPALFLAGLAFALAYGPLTIAATDGVHPREQGLASGLLHTSTQFGSALGISAVTAVYGLAAGGIGSASPSGTTPAEPGALTPEATLSAFRAALTVPVAMAALGALISLLALRAVRHASPVRRASASHTSPKPAHRSGGISSPK
ncbi:MFS transporter [Streptomyces sp. LBUM 1476]|uniref:MFS transporter n=1 Tax=Streptomyces acidiscabies TaxID=42234 RepID=A0AAP6BA79_9ACTN|nr:MFS transporter [Streptomyces acidiscabies]MBP5937640.1 MFS transporter [Streptomyces sp. LBUM 1476]MDX2960895.1 MFS transporter [Streptomyces acidiscabies]MDX3016952.1 MFS transporter [Streptomyces acidiscabies]MDX3788904.1 MFS transporter [Streptomyces acidiscabies]GAV45885.1 putative MFS-type transporter EfpA [Streptomyces acidiscabies]